MNNSINIEQCLYGYQDGHRLLSTSIKLPEDAATQLLLLSDLAPNLSFPSNGSYWTGIPLPSVKMYALMRTWLAPEMSRPGCVWSHTLIIPFAQMARFKDLSILIKYFERPNNEFGLSSYSSSKSINEFDVDYSPYHSFSKQDAVYSKKIIQSIYSLQDIVTAPFGAADNAIFAIWSQQWPRLRRTFSFRTAANLNDLNSYKKTFVLTVYQGDMLKVDDIHFEFNSNNDWESICVYDLIYPGETDFRRFLWRYGSDIRYGRKQFVVLANVYMLSRTKKISGKNLHIILSYITKNFSSLEDGKVLKEDLIGESQYSLLPKTDPIDLLEYFISNPEVKKIQIPTTRLFETLHDSWNERSDQILYIADKAMEHEGEFELNFLKGLAFIVDPKTFIAFTNSRINLRQKLISLNPNILARLELSQLPEEELLFYFNFFPIKNVDEMKIIIRKLILIDSNKIAREAVSRFPNLTIMTVLDVVDQALQKGANPVANVWTQVVAIFTEVILKEGFIESANSTRMLNYIASILGYGQQQVLDRGPTPWAKGLQKAKDNLSGEERIYFLAFLMQLALHAPTEDAETLFELAFEPIHNELLNSKLNWQQTATLLNYLPTLGWLNNWDICLRLRTAVVHVYINNNLSQNSFSRLTNDTKLMQEMLEIAAEKKETLKPSRRPRR